MAVTRLQLGMFRTWRKLDLSLLSKDCPFVVLHGANGVGKSNLLEAVSLLAPGRGMRAAASVNLARQPESLGWQITAEINQKADSYTLRLRANETGRQPALLNEKPVKSADLAQRMRMLWLTPVQDRLFTDSPALRRRFLDRAALTLFPEHGVVAVAYEKAMRERNRLLRDSVFDSAWLAQIERRMAQAGCRLAQARRETVAMLLEHQESAQAAFPAADLQILQDLTLDEAAFAQKLAQMRKADAAAKRSLIGPHISDLQVMYRDKAMLAQACSTGEQKALLVRLVLANARALAVQSGTVPILLLDEIAAHFDSKRREDLYAALAGLDGQIWMSGAERDLFTPLQGQAQFFKVSETAHGSEIASS